MWVSGVQAQSSFSIRQFTTRDGLAHNTVLGTYVDSKGTVWLSTMDGISRYDANGFTTYQSKNYPGLETNFIHSVAELGKDTLFITTRDKGFAYLFVKENRVQAIKPKSGEIAQNQFAIIRFVAHISNDELLIGFSNDVWLIYNLKTEEELILNPDFQLAYTDSYSIEIIENTWYLRTDNLIAEIDIDRKAQQIRLKKTYTTQKIGDKKILSLFSFHNKLIAYIENIGLVFLPSDLSEIEEVLVKESELLEAPRRLYLQDDVLYLLFNTSGFAVYYLNTKQLENIDLNQLSGINFQYVNSISHDTFGNIWAATWGTGLVQIQPFSGISSVPKATEFGKMYSDFNLGILEDSYETLWMLSTPGLIRWNPRSNVMDFIEPQKNASGWHLREDENGIWMSSKTNGLLFLPSKNYQKNAFKNQFVQFDSDSKGLLSTNSTMSLKDKTGRLWITHHNHGIEVYSSEKEFLRDKKPKRLAVFSGNQNEQAFLIQDKSARVLYESKAGEIWAGTFSGGIARLSKKNGELSVWIPDSTDGLRYSHKDIRGFYESTITDSVLWIATYGGGIIKWDRKEKKSVIVDTKTGLSNNFTYGILDDEEGNLWIPTNNGLNRYNPQSGRVQVFTDVDGLNNNEFNTGGIHKGKSGRLYFGGVEGVNFFNPLDLNHKKPLAEVRITSVKAYNRELFNRDYIENNTKLDFEDHYLTFTYSGLDLTEPQKQAYQYRLIGSDTTWIQAGNRTSVSFSNLAPGTYQFEVMGANSDGMWNPKTDSFTFEIIPPFWMTWWFRIIAFITVTGLFVWVIRYISIQKLKEELQRLETEQKVQQERERISRDLHDHVGNQLANILSGVDLMRKYAKHGNQERSDELHGNVKDDLRSTMQQLRETIWTLNKSEVSLSDFVSRLETYFRTRITDNLSITVEIDKKMDIVFAPGKSLNVFRIIQEAVQNSLKYSGADSIHVRFNQVDNKVLITVQDNGSFLMRDDGYEGYGLKNMRQRAEEIGANFEIKADENGTRVILILY